MLKTDRTTAKIKLWVSRDPAGYYIGPVRPEPNKRNGYLAVPFHCEISARKARLLVGRGLKCPESVPVTLEVAR